MPSASSSTRRSRPLLGTFVEIVVPGDPGPGVEAAIDQAFGEVASIHALMSFHERASDVSRLNRGAGDGFIEISPATAEVLAAALELNRVSGGAFDVTIAPHLQRRGLLPACGARRSDPGTMAAGSACPPDRDARAGSDRIELTADGRARLADPQTRIDLGGIAKGYAVDRAIQSLRAHGIASALVNAGGDIAATSLLIAGKT